MRETSSAAGAPAGPGDQRLRDFWFWLLPLIVLSVLGMASIIWLEAPQKWWIAGLALGGVVLLQASYLWRHRSTRHLQLFAIGLGWLAISMVGAWAEVRWLLLLGFAGFLAMFAIRMLLRVDRHTPAWLKVRMYLLAFSFPAGAFGAVSQTEWLLWLGLVGMGTYALTGIGFDIALGVRAVIRAVRRRRGRAKR